MQEALKNDFFLAVPRSPRVQHAQHVAREPGPDRRREEAPAMISTSKWKNFQAKQQRVRLLARVAWEAARFMRRGISVATLSVPLAYIVYVLISVGLVRKEVLTSPWLGRYVEAAVAPAQLLAHNFFAVPLVFQRIDMVVVVCGVVALVLREIVLAPFRRMETLASEFHKRHTPIAPKRRVSQAAPAVSNS